MNLTIIFTGTGTSQGIPVIGCSCPVCTSTDPRDQRTRTSVHLIADSLHLQIDIGADFRQQMLRHHIRQLDAVLLTHEHMDHLAGIDDLRPLIFIQGKPMPLYGSDQTLQAVQRQFPYAFAAPQNRYPGAPELTPCLIDEQRPFTIGQLTITPLPVLHGQWPVLGFRIGDFSYITDANHIPPQTLRLLTGTRYLVLNALRHKPHYSHFTLEEAITIARQVHAEHTYFTHISHDLGLHAQVESTLPPGMHLAYDGLTLHIPH
ncbi:MBL fold metallo-hydrolase [Fischerella thermalis CCMEE 5319]|nr:MBL fold metallo-hydrolase [Fischerella thermalis CCMEE 5319]